ncbi:MAG: alpha/beta hydrolase [Cyanobacteria bacterium P01_D01_bin.1]
MLPKRNYSQKNFTITLPMGNLLGWLALATLLFLSIWTVLPAPNFLLLPLAVGAPEISPLLGGLGIIALGLTLWLTASLPRTVVAALLVAIALNALPLLQHPYAVAAAQNSIEQAFPNSFSKQSASIPAFSFLNFFSGIPQPEVRHQAKIPFASPAGEALFLDVYQPLSAGRYPAVMMIYGGGWRTGSSSENQALGRFLAGRGYVAIAADYRHTPQYQFPSQLEDIAAALAFVRDHADEYEIDPNRIALLGWSAGAQLAMLAGFHSPDSLSGQPIDSVQAVVSYYGPVDLANGYRNPPQPDPLDVRQVLRAYLDGSPDEQPTAYVEASPITYVKAADPKTLPPTLLLYGGRDHIVEAKYGEYLYGELLRSRNTAVWVKIPWSEHAFDKVFNGVGNQMALHFLERFLAQTLS